MSPTIALHWAQCPLAAPWCRQLGEQPAGQSPQAVLVQVEVLELQHQEGAKHVQDPVALVYLQDAREAGPELWPVQSAAGVEEELGWQTGLQHQAGGGDGHGDGHVGGDGVVGASVAASWPEAVVLFGMGLFVLDSLGGASEPGGRGLGGQLRVARPRREPGGYRAALAGPGGGSGPCSRGSEATISVYLQVMLWAVNIRCQYQRRSPACRHRSRLLFLCR